MSADDFSHLHMRTAYLCRRNYNIYWISHTSINWQEEQTRIWQYSERGCSEASESCTCITFTCALYTRSRFLKLPPHAKNITQKQHSDALCGRVPRTNNVALLLSTRAYYIYITYTWHVSRARGFMLHISMVCDASSFQIERHACDALVCMCAHCAHVAWNVACSPQNVAWRRCVYTTSVNKLFVWQLYLALFSPKPFPMSKNFIPQKFCFKIA